MTRAVLSGIAARTGLRLSADVAVDRLVRLGWLLPLRTRDSWEFAPAARAGRFRSGDPWIELRALLQHEPDAPVAVAFESAAWVLGHSSHQPSVPVLAHRRGWRPRRSLGGMRTVTHEWALPLRTVSGLPVWCEATVVVAAADRPAAQGDWANADDWLPETFGATTPDEVLAEASGRRASTLARLGYLAEWSGRRDIADRVAELLPSRLPVSSLGPRDSRDRWSKRWRLYDALLPTR
ncbi:MAG: hypothetical protein HY775_11325 [Acidobacteria bacterium]|nr:hypothetical protein [Acidobacteriota bacterium]